MDMDTFCHLLSPKGTWEADVLATTYPDFRPQREQWKLPLMRSFRSKLDLGFALDHLHLDDHAFC